MEDIVRLENAGMSFAVRVGLFAPRRFINAVDDISLAIKEGEILSLVGESGCGKTTTGKIICGLIKPTKGKILFHGQDIWKMSRREFTKYRRAVQIIHQDPYASLNPSSTVYKILSTPLLKHKIVSNKREALKEVERLLETVGLTPSEDFLHKYPHQLSGGQRQRVAVARTLTVNPKFMVADEPVSMIDVSIRLSILKLLSKLKEELGATFLFITHDLAVARYFTWKGRVAVMYLGNIVEMGSTPKVIGEPLHPYTKALLSAVPEPDPKVTRSKKMMELRSLDIPSLLNLPSGCRFHPRCPFYMKDTCDATTPPLTEVKKDYYVSCLLYGK